MRDDISMTHEQVESYLLQELQTQDPDVTVSIKQTSLGLFKVQVVTNCFEGNSLSEREAKIDDLLAVIKLNLGQNPISDYSLLTPQEEIARPIEVIQLPLWSDILMAPAPTHRLSSPYGDK